MLQFDPACSAGEGVRHNWLQCERAAVDCLL